MFKLKPAFKDYVWGGTALKTIYHKPFDGTPLAESWELSCHPDGESVIESGEYAGKTLSVYLTEHPEAAGEGAFPVLIKFIDSVQPLSVQVHPDDAYAAQFHDQGKTEMWYIISCEKDAFVCRGFEKEISKDEFVRRIEDGTLPEVLRKVYVAPGDVVFIPAGTLHCIGAGITLAEVQQSSNLTYRVFDYGRGRQLHIQDALAVTSLKPTPDPAPEVSEGRRVLAQCQYFKVTQVLCEEEAEITVPESSFVSLLVISGAPELLCGGERIAANPGDSLFIPAGSPSCRITGKCEIVMTTR